MLQPISIQDMAAMYGKTTEEIEVAIEELINHGFMKKLVGKHGAISYALSCPDKKLAKKLNKTHNHLAFVI